MTMLRHNKNAYSVGIVCVFLIMCLYLYHSIDTKTHASGPLFQESNIDSMRREVEELQKVIVSNRNELAALKQQVMDVERKHREEWEKQDGKNEVYDERTMSQNSLGKVNNAARGVNDNAIDDEQKKNIPKPNKGNKVAIVHGLLHQTTTQPSSLLCQLRKNYTISHSDVQMLDVYDLLTFDNPDGGVWKQGWEVKYDESRVPEEKTLHVIVIPHSHCDPGWLRTFEEYYSEQVQSILDGMVKHLSDPEKDMRFIYAEISFFELWWRGVNETIRSKVRELLTSGKFEIVTGGWVMTDEANSHYFSIITELLEGHEWIRNHIGGEFRPTSHWSIDPFGLSPSLPYLLSAANITNAAIQRVHYSVKKHLAKTKQLEFMWRQLWGAHGKSDVRTHVFPFFSYDVPHTCGPDPKICCQFDFRRLPGNKYGCPWGDSPERIDEENVHKRAFTLYDQYRKKSELYQTNVLLVPLGDDFRYDIDSEWVEQYENYKRLFEEMNKNKEWNVNARFGTLSDYFTELDRSLRVEQYSLPVLSGDFFTYSDRDDHYWSGYFTSRPFYKQMDRVLQHQLRAAEIAFSLWSMKGQRASDELFSKLVQARRALSLFQHHDGVTGTAKDHVMEDYGTKMLDALNATEQVLSEGLSGLISGEEVSNKNILLDEYRKNHESLAVRRKYTVGDFVVVFNTLSRSRDESICIHVDSVHAYLRVNNAREIKQQISPIFELKEGELDTSSGYELCFLDELKAFGMNVYEVLDSSSDSRATPAIILSKKLMSINNFKSASIIEDREFTLKNANLIATFDRTTGYLKSVTPKGHKQVITNLRYVHYGVRNYREGDMNGGDNLSGAYLFLPDGDAKEVAADDHDVVIVDGPIVKKVLVAGPAELKILQVYTISQNSPSIEITNEVDIQSTSNFELAMRINTDIESGEDLYTDLNAIQFIRRRRMLEKLPLQAHFYPMPASAYIEDPSTRLSLLGAQPLGVASLKSGELEVMLDRRLNQDDGRGLSQGVLDNHRTLSRFRLLIEPLSSDKDTVNEKVGFFSTVGLSQSMEIHYPVIRMISKAHPNAKTNVKLPKSLPCDVHIVTLRTMASPTNYESNEMASPRNEAALILYRPFTDCRSKLQLRSDCVDQRNVVKLRELFPNILSSSEASLTLLYEGKEKEQVSLKPQDVTTFKLSW